MKTTLCHALECKNFRYEEQGKLVYQAAHIQLDNALDKLIVNFYSTPKAAMGELVKERSFSFSRRSQK
ncbi:hypothetical protein PA25_16640 [Pseudoalteromonas sp. A25]|uniref:hypothetical protein n=1 Tax=Pseudoalteromonas sp. A25 TaxID=116092 RepID=UPI0012604E46|nr:hypothetical protein [Pseudoalteromonas sp. A25]BBN81679.1 hypothetical protein PA25_16640 [Pseudoalteromonas sp. A25]